MNKKNIALLATFICFNSSFALFENAGYQAETGYQADKDHQTKKHHHHHSDDSLTNEADAHRLAVLQKADEEAYFYTNITRTGIVIGLIGLGLGAYGQNGHLMLAGGAVLVASGTAGFFVGHRDDLRSQMRTKERKEILERRSKTNSHHH